MYPTDTSTCSTPSICRNVWLSCGLWSLSTIAKHSQKSTIAAILPQLNVLPVSRGRVYPHILATIMILFSVPGGSLSILLFHAQWCPWHSIVRIFTNLYILFCEIFSVKISFQFYQGPQRVYLFINQVPGYAIGISPNVCLARNTMFAMSATSLFPGNHLALKPFFKHICLYFSPL